MRFSDAVALVTVETGRNENGYPIQRETRAEVFADVQSVKRNEFYAGHQSGLKLALAFTLRTCDYDGQGAVEHDGKRYKVERTYSKDGELVELNCSEERGTQGR